MSNTAKLTRKNLNQTLHIHPTHLEKERQWYVVDASGKTLGRLAVEVAKKIQGKHKVSHNNFRDGGDFVLVTNADKIVTTGYKMVNKKYYRYSGWKGNLKTRTLQEMYEKKPLDILRLAVRGMLPKNNLRDSRMKRLKLIKGTNHQYDHLDLIPLFND